MSIEVVRRVRANYPTPLGARHGAFLLEVAAALGKGLVRKSWGTFITLPDGTGVSQDCVMDPNGVHFDVLEDGENQAKAAWQLVVVEGTDQPLILPMDRYYAVSAPPVQPPATPPPAEGIERMLAAFTDVMGGLAGQIAALQKGQDALRADLAKQQAPDYELRTFGRLVSTFTPKK